MERILTAEEKIRRAEEIYERRRNQNYRNTTATVNVSGGNRDFKLLKKMIIQILICLLIYFIFYLIETTNYVFSASTINKTKEILEYDIDIKGIYTEIKNNLINEQNNNIQDNNSIQENLVTENENNIQDENIEETSVRQNEETNIVEDTIEEADEVKNEEQNKEEKIEENTEENAEPVVNEEVIIEEPITIAQEIKNNYSIIKPANGFISSEFGTREPEGDIVTSYHHGIDIGVIVGTDVLCAIDGEVILATESESYGKYVKVKNGDLVTLYAHCNELLVKVGDTVKQGDKIALSGATGKVTGPHLHFEIIYKGEYINPRDILEF